MNDLFFLNESFTRLVNNELPQRVICSFCETAHLQHPIGFVKKKNGLVCLSSRLYLCILLRLSGNNEFNYCFS